MRRTLWQNNRFKSVPDHTTFTIACSGKCDGSFRNFNENTSVIQYFLAVLVLAFLASTISLRQAAFPVKVPGVMAAGGNVVSNALVVAPVPSSARFL